MKLSKKKGFTLVELLVVIAILAVLASVSVVGYLGFTKKANLSADEQAITQINTYLQASETLKKPSNINELTIELGKDNIDVTDYNPLTKDTYFYWVESINRVIHADADNKVISPSNLKDLSYSAGDWYSLSGDVEVDNSYVVAENTIINNGAQFAGLLEKFSDPKKVNDVKDIKTITLNSDVDLKGASVSLGKMDNSKAITINGNNHTVYGHRVDTNTQLGSDQGEAKKYGYGLFGQVTGNSTVVVENLKINGAVIGETNPTIKTGSAGFLFGKIEGNSNVTVRNVTIENSTIYGSDKAGSICGLLQGGANLTIDNVHVKNSKIYGCAYLASAVGGITSGAGSFASTNSTFENIEFGGNSNQWDKLWSSGGVADKNWEGTNLKDTDIITFEDENNNKDTFLKYGPGSTKYLWSFTTPNQCWLLKNEPIEKTINGKVVTLQYLGKSANSKA